MNRRFLAKVLIGSSLGGGLLIGGSVALYRDYWFEKRVKVILPGKLVRGAWQHREPLRRIVDREGVRTIVTLTAINSTDPKFREQEKVVREKGIRWLIVPMRGSRATPEQLALAADLLGDPANQPVFFHCVAGHHRTSLAHAAYLIRHEGYSADEAWNAVAGLPWARPDSPADRNDRFLIEEFARIQRSLVPSRGHGVWEIDHEATLEAADQTSRRPDRVAPHRSPGPDRLESSSLQLRNGSAGPGVPLRADDGKSALADSS